MFVVLHICSTYDYDYTVYISPDMTSMFNTTVYISSLFISTTMVYVIPTVLYKYNSNSTLCMTGTILSV